MSDLAPGFLVAVPQLGDPNFSRAVVLMMEHTAEGALGIIFNRPARMTLADVGRSQAMDVHAGQRDAAVFVGGPVQVERGFLLHRRPELPESVQLLSGLWVSSSMESLRILLATDSPTWRLCLGYAGWGPGQLEKELREGAWIMSPPDVQHVLETPPQKAWEAVIRGMGIDPMMLLHTTGLH